jgi:hypothetical protein
MSRFRVVAQIVAAVVLLSLLLTACRVPDVPTTDYPQVGSYPNPRPQSPTHAATVVKPTVVKPTAVKPTALPIVPAPTANPAPTQATTPGEVAFSITIIHSGEVAGEVIPCG